MDDLTMRQIPRYCFLALLGISSCVLEDQGEPYPDFGLLAYSYLSDSLKPAIVNGSLVAVVGYSGCTDPKPFQLKYRILNATEATVWLHSPGNTIEPCDGYFTQAVELRIPDKILDLPRILLLARRGESFVLRPAE